MTKSISILFLALSFSISVFTAKVIGITDGDSIVVLNEKNEQIKIRLEGIDCPEKGQAFGQKAKQATSDLCFNRSVRIEKYGTDFFGRTLARVYVGNVCVNKELIKQGMAWHFKKYNKDPELAKLEIEARKAKVGLWAPENAIAPWNWRKIKK
jgi:micrococcal nuclease